MKKFKLLKLGFFIALLIGASSAFSQVPSEDINPINILMDPVATDCGVYDVELSVQQYVNVANISMTLDLNSLVTAGAYTGITLSPAIASAVTYINPAGNLKLGWSSDPFPANALTLPDNYVLFTLHFDVNGIWGTSHDLAWDDVLTIDCELSGPNGFPIYADYWNDLHWDIQNQLSIDGVQITPVTCPVPPAGAIDLTVSGGVPPYTFEWTGPNGFTATTEDISGLAPGDYYVTVTDADFCVVNGGPYTVIQAEIPGPGEVGGPVAIASTVQCIADAGVPTLPVVEDYCGLVLTPTGPVMGGTYVDCEGTYTYTYTYTDFQGETFVWTYTYTIDRIDAPAEVGGPVQTASTVACIGDATAPTTLPVVEDVCGVELFNPTLVEGGTYVDCEGTKTYTYTWTDCALLTYDWTYTYTIEVEDFTMPADDGETITCSDLLYTPTPPTVTDYCGNPITPTGPVVSTTPPCNGTVTYVWNYEDCEGNNHDWTYTFTINDNIDPTITCPDNVTVFMNDGCTAINVDLGTPVVADNCTAIEDLNVDNDAVEPFAEGTTIVTWTVEDCAGNSATCEQLVTVLRNNLSGTLVYNNIAPFGPDKIMNNVQITLFDNLMIPLATSTTNYTGNYSFPNLCAGTYHVAITNNNKPAGGVNITDAGMVMVFGAVANPSPIEKVNWLAGDVDLNLSINTFDVAGVFGNFVYGIPFGNVWNYYWAGETTNDANTAPSLPMAVTIGGGNLVKGIFGQCTGDFNGNFAPGVMKSASESLTLDYSENMLVSSGSEFELPVNAGMDMEVGAVSLILNFPADEVEITNVFFTSDPSAPLQYNVVGNELRIGWYSLAPVWLNKGESLVTIKMKTSSENDVMFSLADSDLNELADGNFKVIDNASLIIDIPSTSSLGIGVNLSAEQVDFTSYPNPFKGTTTLTYSLPVDGQVLIEVYNLVGSKVKVAIDESQSAGEYSLNLDASNLQPGVYTAILKLKSSDAKVTTRVIKMINR